MGKTQGLYKLVGGCPGYRTLATFAWGVQGPRRAVESMMMMMMKQSADYDDDDDEIKHI